MFGQEALLCCRGSRALNEDRYPFRSKSKENSACISPLVLPQFLFSLFFFFFILLKLFLQSLWFISVLFVLLFLSFTHVYYIPFVPICHVYFPSFFSLIRPLRILCTFSLWIFSAPSLVDRTWTSYKETFLIFNVGKCTAFISFRQEKRRSCWPKELDAAESYRLCEESLKEW